MSSVSEAAFTAPPVGRPFDFSKAVAGARKLLVKRVLPNARDILSDIYGGSKVVYKKTAALGVWFASPLLWLEEVTAFNDADYPVRKRVPRKRERRGALSTYVGMPTMAAATFMAAMLAPTSFNTRSHIQGYEPDFTIISESDAAASEVETFVTLSDSERAANRARINREYEERRARQQPVEVAPVYAPAEQEFRGVQVTSPFGGDEYGDREY